MVATFDGSCGFGEWDNLVYVRRMENSNPKDQKKLIKILYNNHPKEYSEWKNWCIRLNQLPDFFGTEENPIPIDESKL